MENQKLDELCTDVCKKLFDQIQNKDEGVLHQVIHILVDEKTAKKICSDRGIKENDSIENDRKINSSERQGWEILKTDVKEIPKLIRKSIDLNMHFDKVKVKEIVTIACLLVGESACIEYLNESKETPNSKTRQLSPSALCLVVPASVVENVRENHKINVSDIEKLIDNSLYFLCTSPEDANKTWERLDRTDEDITTVSEQREVYIRIDIDGGEDMIGKKVQYILKRNLPQNGQVTVKELACLKYLSISGLEKFNRISGV
ncbi:MAG TPA: hypothetical protein DCS91_20265 [Microcoleaceae bacterium UBA11344]|nr:hypothetical protein [Microcoleaceae cyanobacterium UBA11344]